MQTKQVSKTQKEIIEENKANIDGWKERHKTVKVITVKSKQFGLVSFIVGKPTNAMMDPIAQYNAEKKPHKIEEMLINSCILAGDKEKLNEDVDLKTEVLGIIGDMLEKLEVERKGALESALINEAYGADINRKIYAILKWRMGIPDPNLLSPEERNKAYADYLFLRTHDREFHLNILRQALYELLNGTEEDG